MRFVEEKESMPFDYDDIVKLRCLVFRLQHSQGKLADIQIGLCSLSPEEASRLDQIIYHELVAEYMRIEGVNRTKALSEVDAIISCMIIEKFGEVVIPEMN
jgi:hypothetical protein